MLTQLEFQTERRGASQNDRILARLRETPGEWVSMPELERLSGSHRLNSRAADLRRRLAPEGRTIECKTEWQDGICKSFYRITNTDPKWKGGDVDMKLNRTSDHTKGNISGTTGRIGQSTILLCLLACFSMISSGAEVRNYDRGSAHPGIKHAKQNLSLESNSLRELILKSDAETEEAG